MFIADMFCYGKDPICVGVSGILGCMGAFVTHNNMLYVVHIPDSFSSGKAGVQTFARWVLSQDPTVKGSRAYLYGVTNRGHHSKPDEEMRLMARLLGLQGCYVITLLSTPVGRTKAESTAVVCTVNPQTKEPIFSAKPDEDVTDTSNGGYRTGAYKGNPNEARKHYNLQGWTPITKANSRIYFVSA